MQPCHDRVTTHATRASRTPTPTPEPEHRYRHHHRSRLPTDSSRAPPAAATRCTPSSVWKPSRCATSALPSNTDLGARRAATPGRREGRGLAIRSGVHEELLTCRFRGPATGLQRRLCTGSRMRSFGWVGPPTRSRSEGPVRCGSMGRRAMRRCARRHGFGRFATTGWQITAGGLALRHRVLQPRWDASHREPGDVVVLRTPRHCSGAIPGVVTGSRCASSIPKVNRLRRPHGTSPAADVRAAVLATGRSVADARQ